MTRVFIVDDHALVREWLSKVLSQAGLLVSGCSDNAKDGLSSMRQSPPDVAVVDLSLQGASGLDLIKQISDELPTVRVVVLSMHEEMIYVERAFRCGAKGYVTKREATIQIIEAVGEVTAGRVYASRPVLSRLAERVLARTSSGEVDALSDRELEVYRRLGSGHSTRKIADDLSLSIKTVQAYCARIKEKLGHVDGVALVRDAIRWVDRSDLLDR